MILFVGKYNNIMLLFIGTVEVIRFEINTNSSDPIAIDAAGFFKKKKMTYSSFLCIG